MPRTPAPHSQSAGFRLSHPSTQSSRWTVYQRIREPAVPYPAPVQAWTLPRRVTNPGELVVPFLSAGVLAAMVQEELQAMRSYLPQPETDELGRVSFR